MDLSPRIERVPSPERLRLLLLVLFPVLLVLSAWVQDDAYITFRAVDHLLAGYGPTWNPIERVQVFTHPLWMLLHVPVLAAVGKIYPATLLLSVACSLAAFMLLLARVARTAWAAVVAGFMLVTSRAFIDFSTSGLENPLTHLLLVLYAWVLVREMSAERRGFLLGLSASLLALARPDALLLVLPGLAIHLGAHHPWRAPRVEDSHGGASSARKSSGRVWWAAVLGTLPLVAWEIFALIYYGFLLPNTAYAKLGTGLPRLALIEQGGYYLLYSLLHDPVTVAGLVLGGVVAWRFGGVSRCLMAGAGLYVVYVVWIGGGYMGGRFLSAPLVLAALAIAVAPLVPSRRQVSMGLGVGCLLLFATGLAPFLGERAGIPGVGDERARFNETTGLVQGLGEGVFDGSWPRHLFRRKGDFARRHELDVVLDAYIGMLAYHAGPGVHVVDLIGLTDPLLARLPTRLDGTSNRLGTMAWKPGHLPRPVPEGYLESVRSASSSIVDPGLRAYDDALRRITRGPLWSASRWRAILDFHRGTLATRVETWAASSPPELAPPPKDLRTLFTFDADEVLRDAAGQSSDPTP